MIKKILAGSLFTAMLLLSGCGDSEGEDHLAIQQMLDKGDYLGVIAALEGSEDSNDDYIALGAAYMGKAGVSLTNIVSAMASSEDTDDDGFSTFVKSIAGISTATAITDLGKSADNYRMVVGDCTSHTLSDSAKDICLFIGLGATTRTAVTIDSLVGDISTFADDAVVDDKLTASVCAMQYAYNGVELSDCNISTDGSVTFSVLEKTYDKFTVDVNATDYYFLMTEINGTINNQTVLTNGYCADNDFSTRVDEYNSTALPALHACPINEDKDAEELATASVLVTILNDGMESISAAVTEDIQEDVNEFKCEILGGTHDEFSGCMGADIIQDISEQNIIDYLNAQNIGV